MDENMVSFSFDLKVMLFVKKCKVIRAEFESKQYERIDMGDLLLFSCPVCGPLK